MLSSLLGVLCQDQLQVLVEDGKCLGAVYKWSATALAVFGLSDLASAALSPSTDSKLFAYHHVI